MTRKEVRAKVFDINRQLSQMGYTLEEIEQFWKDSIEESRYVNTLMKDMISEILN